VATKLVPVTDCRDKVNALPTSFGPIDDLIYAARLCAKPVPLFIINLLFMGGRASSTFALIDLLRKSRVRFQWNHALFATAQERKIQRQLRSSKRPVQPSETAKRTVFA
jgi:hypothetical protein